MNTFAAKYLAGRPEIRGESWRSLGWGGRLEFNRVWAMPSSETFDIEPIHNFVWKYLSESKVSIDPFARNKRWATHTNDLNPDTQAEHHLEALEFLELLHSRGVKADFAVFDPPYSITQCAQVYQGVGRPFLGEDSQQQGGWYKHREILNQLLSNEATVLTFGWNSIGMGKKYGFGLEEILLVCHGRAHNDTICIAEKRLQGGLWK